MVINNKLHTFIYELANIYKPFFNVETNTALGSTSLTFKAEYNRRDEKYMISKKMTVWGVENQQVIFVTTPEERVTSQYLHTLKTNIQQHFRTFIPRNEEHMSTVFLSVIVTNNDVNNDILKEVRKYRKIKFMNYGLHGWAEFYIALVHLQEAQLMIHPKGRQFVKPIEKLLKEEKIII